MAFTLTHQLQDIGCGSPSVICTMVRIAVCVTCVRIVGWRVRLGASSGGFLLLGEVVDEAWGERSEGFTSKLRNQIKKGGLNANILQGQTA